MKHSNNRTLIVRFGLKSLTFSRYDSSRNVPLAGFSSVWRVHLTPCGARLSRVIRRLASKHAPSFTNACALACVVLSARLLSCVRSPLHRPQPPPGSCRIARAHSQRSYPLLFCVFFSLVASRLSELIANGYGSVWCGLRTLLPVSHPPPSPPVLSITSLTILDPNWAPCAPTGTASLPVRRTNPSGRWWSLWCWS